MDFIWIHPTVSYFKCGRDDAPARHWIDFFYVGLPFTGFLSGSKKGWKGWLEDRRPASNGDPYKIAGIIVKTVKGADVS